MENILDFLRTDTYIYILTGVVLLLLILYIANFIKLRKLRKSYKEFMIKLGNGQSIDETLQKHIESVYETRENLKEMNKYCEVIDKNMKKCLQKVGLVRYNAFQDTGSDLSFALAILDSTNDGVVLNGIFSREMSNIYAKSIQGGKAQNTLSEEEKEALEIAINSK